VSEVSLDSNLMVFKLNMNTYTYNQRKLHKKFRKMRTNDREGGQKITTDIFIYKVRENDWVHVLEDGDDMVISQPKFSNFYFFILRDWKRKVIWIEKKNLRNVTKMPKKF
jgi:hypothetical protein